MIIRTEEPHTSVYLRQLRAARAPFLHTRRTALPGGGLKETGTGRRADGLRLMADGKQDSLPSSRSRRKESEQRRTSRFQPIKNAFWGTTEHQPECAHEGGARVRCYRAAAPAGALQMICLLRSVSLKLLCTSIHQHPREARPLAGKRSKSQRATTERKTAARETGLAPARARSRGRPSSTATVPKHASRQGCSGRQRKVNSLTARTPRACGGRCGGHRALLKNS